jgi:hypothetical protein
MSGLAYLEGFVVGAVTALTLFLSWSLLGPELSIILMATIALGIALNLTPSHEPGLASSPPPSHRSRFLRTERLFADTPTDRVCVTPDSPVLYRRRQKKPSKRLGGVQRSLSFDEEL